MKLLFVFSFLCLCHQFIICETAKNFEAANIVSRLKTLKKLEEIEKKLNIYEHFFSTFQVPSPPRFVQKEQALEQKFLVDSQIQNQLGNYTLTNRTVAPPGDFCSSEDDCKSKMGSFYQQVKTKLSGQHGGHGDTGDKGPQGAIGPRGEQGVRGNDAEVPSAEYLDFLAKQAVEDVLRMISES